MITQQKLEELRDRFYAERNEDKIGIHKDITNAEYHAGPGLSNSGCGLLDKSVKHLVNKPKLESDALTFGTGVHARVLEPDVWDEFFVRGPDNLSTKSKEWRNTVEAAAADEITVMKPELYDKVELAYEGIMANPIAAQLLSEPSGVSEVSAYASSKYHDILLRVRPDLWIKDADIIVDLKTTKCAAPRGNNTFAKSCGQWRYDRQAAMYSDVMEQLTGNAQDFYFVAVESEEPFDTVVYRMSDEDIRAGRADYMANVYDLAQFLRDPSSHSYGYTDEIQEIQIPKYFRRK